MTLERRHRTRTISRTSEIGGNLQTASAGNQGLDHQAIRRGGWDGPSKAGSSGAGHSLSPGGGQLNPNGVNYLWSKRPDLPELFKVNSDFYFF